MTIHRTIVVVEELLPERGIDVDHVTVYRWVQRFTPLFTDAGRPCRHAAGDRWFVDETYLKVAGRWEYLYRAVDQFGQVIDVLASDKRDTAAARRFFIRALRHGSRPVVVSTDRAPAYVGVLEDLLPAARHVTEQHGNNRVEADHGRLKARLRPMLGLKRLATAAVIAVGHAFVQNLRRGHYELGIDTPPELRLAAAFTDLALATYARRRLGPPRARRPPMQHRGPGHRDRRPPPRRGSSRRALDRPEPQRPRRPNSGADLHLARR